MPSLWSVRRRVPALDRALQFGHNLRRVGTPAPVLVYSAGKVGSMALAETVERGLGRRTVHLHFVTREGRRLDAAEAARFGTTPSSHRWNADYAWVRTQLQRRRRWEVVTGARDPVSRSISSVFETAGAYGLVRGGEGSLDVIHREVVRRIDVVAGRASWFDRELRAVCGVDVLARPFDVERGYEIHEHGRFRVLLVRFEDLRRVGGEALGTFLGVGAPELSSTNVAASKPYAELYERYRSTVRFPAPLLDRAYGTREAQALYRPEELAELRRRWVA